MTDDGSCIASIGLTVLRLPATRGRYKFVCVKVDRRSPPRQLTPS